eukprot:TRINITY_DN7028_c5_g1_i1.p1 TRINITY_DN7028_c5_g1~~TRINITY_DN7028_c5_g1_i1.p1  ORF type:complete len:383 (+),score=67.84 TRINITY_DN7028_c5_g1_i1:61-1149(+)
MGACSGKDRSKPFSVSPNDTLHVVTTVFNPAGFKTRTELYRRFERDIKEKAKKNVARVVLWTVEAQFPDQEGWAVTDSNNPHHIQVKAHHKIWLKENLINIAIKERVGNELCKDGHYLAWLDADITFDEERFADKTIAALQTHDVVQMFEEVKYLGPSGEVLGSDLSKAYHVQHDIDASCLDRSVERPNPGLALACTWEGDCRLSNYGKQPLLFEYNIVGGNAERMTTESPNIHSPLNIIEPYLSDGYHKSTFNYHVKEYSLFSKCHFGYVAGVTVRHMWHGDWKDRQCVSRWACLHSRGALFDPTRDIRKTSQGVIYLSAKGTKFEEQIENYFESRNEDSKKVVTSYKNRHDSERQIPMPS